MFPFALACAVAIVILLILWKALRPKRVIIYEYQKGLKYKKGRYVGTLGPGQYWIASLPPGLLGSKHVQSSSPFKARMSSALMVLPSRSAWLPNFRLKIQILPSTKI